MSKVPVPKVARVQIVENFDRTIPTKVKKPFKFVNSRHAKHRSEYAEQMKDTRMLRGEYNQATAEGLQNLKRYNEFERKNVRLGGECTLIGQRQFHGSLER